MLYKLVKFLYDSGLSRIIFADLEFKNFLSLDMNVENRGTKK